MFGFTSDQEKTARKQAQNLLGDHATDTDVKLLMLRNAGYTGSIGPDGNATGQDVWDRD